MTTLPIKGFRLGKDGKLQRVKRKASISEAIRQRKSKRVRVKRRGDSA